MGNLRPIERDPQRSEAPADQYHRRIDDVTGEVWLCKGDALAEAEDNIEPIAKLTQATTIVGQDGDILAVDADGRATVKVAEPVNMQTQSRPVPATNWHVLIDGGTNTTAIVLLKPQATFAAIVAASKSGAVLVNPDNWPVAHFIFGGTEADGNTINYVINRIYKCTTHLGTSYLPILAAAGTAALSAATYGAAATAFGATGNLWADTITLTAEAPGIGVYSPAAADLCASLWVDFWGAEAMIVEVDIATGTTGMDVFACLCDSPHIGGSTLST